MAVPGLGRGFSVQLDGAPAVIAKIRALPEFGRDWSRETVKRAAEAGAEEMKVYVHEGLPGTGSDFPPNAQVSPGSRRGSRPDLKSRIVSGKPKYKPGGPGGGGTWTSVFGVGGNFGNPKSHDPAWIHTFGSGIRGKANFASGSVIMSRSPSHLMTFMVAGRQVWARSVGGQRPHEEYVDRGVSKANTIIQQRIASFGRGFRQARTL